MDCFAEVGQRDLLLRERLEQSVEDRPDAEDREVILGDILFITFTEIRNLDIDRHYGSLRLQC
ncbi:hypothetical protein [Sphingorhabdus sp.]|uniref:hypothetical protein n=1 Tax=Sphingorhabdus sp. TaxID=1902408 RepID=UPI003594134B